MDDERLRRHDLTDAEWDRLAPLLPADPPRGGRWLDHRMVINGVVHRTRAGCAWRDLPPWYGSWKTVYNRHRRWSLDGTWEKILDGLRVGCDEAEREDWTVGVDSTVVRAHQHAAGARRTQPSDLPSGGTVQITVRTPRRSVARGAGSRRRSTWSPIVAAVRSPA